MPGDYGADINVIVNEPTTKESHGPALVWAHGGGAVSLTAK